MVWGLGFGFRVWGSGARVWGAGFEVNVGSSGSQVAVVALVVVAAFTQMLLNFSRLSGLGTLIELCRSLSGFKRGGGWGMQG